MPNFITGDGGSSDNHKNPPKISHFAPGASIIDLYQAEGVIAARVFRGEESPNTAGQRAS